MSDKRVSDERFREQAIKDVAKAADNSPSYIRLCLRDVKMPCDDSLIFQFAVTQREAVLELRERLEVLLEEHSCDDGSVDYDGRKTECERCTPVRAALERSK